MIRYFIHRLILMAFVLFIVITVTFFVSILSPGDPSSLWAGNHPTEEQLEAARKKFSLDKPVYVQYAKYVGQILKLNLGTSIRTQQPVSQELTSRFLATFELVTFSFIVALTLGFSIGIYVAINANTATDYFFRGFSYLGMAFPAFWLGMILQLIFFGYLELLPLQGRTSFLDTYHNHKGLFLINSFISGDWDRLIDTLLHLALPATTLAISIIGIIVRTVRSAALDTVDQNHFTTFLSYGFSRSEAFKKLAYKNTLIPFSTVSGLSYGLLLGGTFLLEVIFDWPGLGQFSALSIITNDYPAIMGATLLYALIYISVNIIIDLLYVLIDPRVNVE